MEILKHRNFNPRLVEWLSKYTNVKALPAKGYRAEVERVLENPEELWNIAFEQQISEAARSVLLALYSLGGSTHLDRLEGAWKVLHKQRAKKYNWKTAAEDWRRSLQDLEGGFLLFNAGKAAFVNPSVKDFLDSTLTRDTEHLDDLLSAACRFEQIVTIWSLVTSEKGRPLRKLFKEASGQLMGAINQNLQTPHEEKVSYEGGGYAIRALDVRPEIRLHTMVSVADDTRSVPALKTVISYTQSTVTYWSKGAPDLDDAVSVLHALDRAKWDRLSSLDLGQQIKASLLSSLTQDAGSTDIASLVGYAESKNARWTKEEQKTLVGIAERYFDSTFDEELADSTTERELEDLSETLGGIGRWCAIDIDGYQDQINQAIADLPQSEGEDDQAPHQWERTGQPMSEQTQEAEVRRLFDGLR
jgi:hypothetical protein